MQGLKVIFRKELADHFSSYRFLVLFALIWMVSLVTTYVVGMSIRQELQGIAKPKFVFLLLFTAQGGSSPWYSLSPSLALSSVSFSAST